MTDSEKVYTIINICCDHYGIDINKVLTGDRHKEVLLCRQMAQFLSLRMIDNVTLNFIAESFRQKTILLL